MGFKAVDDTECQMKRSGVGVTCLGKSAEKSGTVFYCSVCSQ